MAIKEKLPSPSEIAKSIEKNEQETPGVPQQENSNQEVKFATEEIEKIQKLQADLNTTIFQFGQLKINQNRSNYSKNIETRVFEIPLLKNDTDNVINFNLQNNVKKKFKKRYFWNLLKDE